MAKDKHIILEIDSFSSKNDCNRAINCMPLTNGTATEWTNWGKR